MKKIPTLFVRDEQTKLVTSAITVGCEWVLEGNCLATRKYDGTCCRVLDGKLWKRYDAKKGKTPPPNFEAAQEPDLVTGHHPGWLPVGDDPADQWHREAWKAATIAGPGYLPDGTYELIGPKIQGNPEGWPTHALIAHGSEVLNDAPRTFDGLAGYLGANNIEGIVWHRSNGDMAKVKKRDFWKHR